MKAFLAVILISLSSVAFGQSALRPAKTFDEKLFMSINGWGAPSWDGVMWTTTNSVTVAVVGVPLGLYGYGYFAHDPRIAADGIDIGFGEGVAGIVTNVLKVLIKRDRPFLTLEGVRQPGSPAGGYSMPSGHATGAWAAAGGLMFHYPTWQVIIPSTLYAVAVSLSRSYEGVHYPSDLLAGATIGLGSEYLAERYQAQIMSLFSWALPSEDSTKSSGFLLMPSFDGSNVGLTFAKGF